MSALVISLAERAMKLELLETTEPHDTALAWDVVGECAEAMEWLPRFAVLRIMDLCKERMKEF